MGEEASPGDPSPARKAKKAAEEQKKKPPPRPWEVVPAAGQAAPEGITAADLFALEFPPAQLVVDGLLGPGLTVLGGKPKGGKSWLALLLGWAVAAGAEVDGRATWQGEVLYLALEDTRRRLKGRLQKLHADLGWVVPETLTIQTAWPRADEGGLYHVAEWLAARKKAARLVIVDVLAKFRKPVKGNGNNYADDYEAVGGLKELVDHYEASALVIHHTRKLKAEDPFDELSGTYGISGPADTLMMLDSDAGAPSARLYVRGRDLSEGTTPMTYTRDSGRWVLGATADGIDTTGRASADGTSEETKLERCMTWLRQFLAVHAYPSDEIQDAAVKAGFNFTQLKNAKAKLGAKGTREVTHHNYGSPPNNDWWSGRGKPLMWTLRPKPAGDTGDTGASGGSEAVPE